MAVVTGTYAEPSGGPRGRGILTARTLTADGRSDRAEYIDVTVRGVLRTAIFAIGGETTGATITAGSVTWELALNRSQQEAARRLSGNPAIISGQLRHERGVEIRNRFIVTVQSIQAPP